MSWQSENTTDFESMGDSTLSMLFKLDLQSNQNTALSDLWNKSLTQSIVILNSQSLCATHLVPSHMLSRHRLILLTQSEQFCEISVDQLLCSNLKTVQFYISFFKNKNLLREIKIKKSDLYYKQSLEEYNQWT